jgi:concentrative nucleoside transporter, CNT family
MSCGMAGVAGTVMVVYATMLGPIIPNALGNILICSVISTPAALAVAALMVPFGPGDDHAEISVGEEPAGAFDALIRGTRDGIAPLVGIVTVLLVTVAVVALVNMILGRLLGGVTLQELFALVFRPVMWLIGDFAKLPEGALAPQSRLILTYGCAALPISDRSASWSAGSGAMVPERRREITALGLRSILSGTIATCMSGAVAGLPA